MNKVLKYTFLYLFILTITLFYSSCKEETVDPPFLGYEYFPNEANTWVEYKVDSIRYDDQFGHDTFNFELREIIESKFIDNEGRDAQRIERYKRGDSTANWQIRDVWYANLTNTTAEKVEENVRFVKLNFPLKLDRPWDGNIFNTMDEQEYEIIKLNEPYSINGMSFDSTVTVLHIDFVTLVSEDYSIEVYAKNIGLVHKKFISTVLDQSTGLIKTGKEFEYIITGYGS